MDVTTKQKHRIFVVGKLDARPTVATTLGGVQSSRLILGDFKNKLYFLIDTGADISVLPLSSAKGNVAPSEFKVYAADGTPIPTFGSRTLSLDLGLRQCLSVHLFGCASNVAFTKPRLVSLKAFLATSVHWIGVLPLFDPLSRSFKGVWGWFVMRYVVKVMRTLAKSFITHWRIYKVSRGVRISNLSRVSPNFSNYVRRSKFS